MRDTKTQKELNVECLNLTNNFANWLSGIEDSEKVKSEGQKIIHVCKIKLIETQYMYIE